VKKYNSCARKKQTGVISNQPLKEIACLYYYILAGLLQVIKKLEGGHNFMTKENGTLKLDFDSFISITESIVDNDPHCQEALEKSRKLYESLKEKNLIEEAREVDEVTSYIETVVREAVYKAAFQRGMRFILDTIAGKEVVEI